MTRNEITTASKLPIGAIFYFKSDKDKTPYIVKGGTRKAISYNTSPSSLRKFPYDQECKNDKTVVFLRHDPELV